MSLKLFVFIYLLGGVTFIPVSIFIFILFYKQNWFINYDYRNLSKKKLLVNLDSEFKAGSLVEKTGVNVFKKGWITVTTEYYCHFTEVSDHKIHNSNLTRDKLKKRHQYYAILKHGNLFLYKDENLNSGALQVIVLHECFISIWPRTQIGTSKVVPDSSLFTKRTCISIWKRQNIISKDSDLEFRLQPSNQYFIYIDNNSDKEDWYFDLINASKIDQCDNLLNPCQSANTLHLVTKDVLYLIQSINSTEDQLLSKWFNALVGRLFLSLQQTDTLKQFAYQWIYTKLTKINKPGFLDDFKLEKVDLGDSVPMITNQKLLELTPEGLLKIGFNLSYNGNFSFIVSAKVNINLGTRFKKREVTIGLSFSFNKIQGPMILMIKPPPSNRIWYGFESEPEIQMDIEPVVSTHQLSYNMITNMIKSKFREAIKDSLVFPHMDDFVFYDTEDDLYRGGIWSHSNTGLNTINNEVGNDLKPNDKSEDEYIGKDNTEELENPLLERENFDNKISDSELHQVNRSDFLSEHFINIEIDSNPDISLENESSTDSYLKHRTLRKVESFKTMMKSKTTPDYDLNLNQDTNDFVFNNNTSKRYLQSGIKKIGKWYKDQINSVSESSNEENVDLNYNLEKQHVPEMISNRRTILKHKVQGDDEKSLYNESNSSQISSGMFVNTLKSKNVPFRAVTQTSPILASSHTFHQNLPSSVSNLASQLITKSDSYIDSPFESLDKNENDYSKSISQTELEKNVENDEKEANEKQSSLILNGKVVNLQELSKRRPIPPSPQNKDICIEILSEFQEPDPNIKGSPRSLP